MGKMGKGRRTRRGMEGRRRGSKWRRRREDWLRRLKSLPLALLQGAVVGSGVNFFFFHSSSYFSPFPFSSVRDMHDTLFCSFVLFSSTIFLSRILSTAESYAG
jgi:hypothetical protein